MAAQERDDASKLPDKLYYRIGEVASLVGVEPHVLRYWEREFRTIRPRKSARGQRVYSRRDVETLMRVRELLYSEGFTIAGARRRLQQERSGNGAALEPAPEDLVATSASAIDDDDLESDASAASEPELSPGLGPNKVDGGRGKRAPAIERSLPLFDPIAFSPAREREPAPQSDRLTAPITTSVDGDARHDGTHRAAIAQSAAGNEAVRSMLRELRGEIETFLDDLG